MSVMSPRRAPSAAIALLRPGISAPNRIMITRPLGRRGLTLASSVAAPLRYRQQHTCLSSRRCFATNVKDAHIAVVGGGLTGLTTAYYLAKQLPSTAKITLYEASHRLGGWIKTDKVPVDVEGKKGTVHFERGPRTLTSLSTTSWRFDDLVLYDLALDLGLKPVSPPDCPRYIYYPDHLVPMPPAISLFDIPREPLFTEAIGAAMGLLLKSMLRMEKTPMGDPSIAEWLRAISMSSKATSTFASAMVHGIYGGDIDKLSARSVLDRMYWGWYMPSSPQGVRPMPVADHELLQSLGQDKQIQRLALEPKGALLHFGEAGMEALPKALAAALYDQQNVTVKLSSPIASLDYDKEGQKMKITSANSDQSPSTFDKVISTTSAQTLTTMTSALPSIANEESVSIMTVNLWYPTENLKPTGFGYLIPRTVPPEENPDNALGVFFDSDTLTRGPDEPTGTKLFVLMGGHYYNGRTPPTEEEAIQQAKRLLARQLGIREDTPCVAMARLAKDCIPQHTVGHGERLKAAHGELREAFGGRLSVAGGSYHRIGAIAALRTAYEIATTTVNNGIDAATGLEFTENLGVFAGVPVTDIPVRRWKGLNRGRDE